MVSSIDEALLQHLVDEFLDHGQRAADYLRTAYALVQMETGTLPRHGELLAYAIREALKAIIESQPIGQPGRWRVTSRAVVEAKEHLVGVSADREEALEQLLSAIDAMAETHDQERIHQRRLLAVILNRTGAEPLATGTEPVVVYQDLLDRADRAVHGDTDMVSASKLWEDCVAIIRRLFSPPDVRHRELEELASKTDPDDVDVGAALALISSPAHMVVLLRAAATPAWFRQLAQYGALDPPEGPSAWPGYAGVDRHKADHAELAEALQTILTNVSGSPDKRAHVARAALDLGAGGWPPLLEILRMDPGARSVAAFAIYAAAEAPSESDFVEQVADLVLTPQSWTAADHYVNPLMAAFVAGATSSNFTNRMKIVGYKLRAISLDDLDRRHFAFDVAGISENRDHREDQPFNMLMAAAAGILKARAGDTALDELLKSIDLLPEDVQRRVRTWLLGLLPEAPVATLIDDVATSIGRHSPTRDDLALVDRVVSEADASAYEAHWRKAMGRAPEVVDVGRATGAHDVPSEWLYRFQWAGILPDEVSTAWAGAISVLAGSFGPPGRARVEFKSSVEVGYGRSPLSTQEIKELSVDDASRWIAAWRPDPNQWLVSARELGRTLQEAVTEEAAKWVSNVLRTISTLNHPTYIQHYLAGVTAALPMEKPPVSDLLDAVLLTRTHPWEVTALGRDDFDYDATWRPTEIAGIALLKALADTDTGFADRDDDAWDIIRSETLNTTEPSAIGSSERDPLTRGINRSCTRALEAVVSFAAYEYRRDGRIREAVTDVLTQVLQATGIDGQEYRAVLASRLRFLHAALPEWLDRNHGQLFGVDAPDDPGQMSVDVALRYERPNRWLIQNYRNQIEDAVTRDSENAIEHYLIGLLWHVEGYSVEHCVPRLAAVGRLSAAAESMGRLLREGEVSGENLDDAVEFWRAAIATNSEDLQGFGWYAEIDGLSDEKWAELTAATLERTSGRIDWSHEVAERSARSPVTTTKLIILDSMIRGVEKEWDRRRIGEIAVSTVKDSTDLNVTSEFRRLHTALSERGYLQ